MAETQWTVMEVVKWATDDLAARGADAPRLDAEVLVANALGITRVGLYLAHDRLLTPDERTAIRQRLERRRRGEPVAYILGTREFYGLDFYVDPRVLIPRPETELVVDEALAALPEHSVGGRVLDLCTGSGAIAVAIARARQTAQVDAVDASADALAVARANVLRQGAHNVRLLHGDLFAPLEPARYDVVVSNPPYVQTAAIAKLPVDVAKFEPRLALDGGQDGLDVLRRIVADIPAWLAPTGALVLEVGAEQAPQVLALAERHGAAFERRVRSDYAGIERLVVMRGRGRA